MNIIYLLLKRFEEHRSEAVINLLGNGDKMLDVGCGNGDLAIMTSKKFNSVYGIDISGLLIFKAKKMLKKKKIGNVYLNTANVNRGLPFEDKKFDVVTSVASLAFFIDPYFAISEFNRVLRKHGTLIIEVPNLAYLPRRLTLFLGNLPKVASSELGWDGGHLHYFTQRSLKESIEKSGFQITKITGSGIFAYLRNWWPSLLCGNIIIKAVKK